MVDDYKLEKKNYLYYVKRFFTKPDINEIELVDWMGNRYAFRSEPGYIGLVYGIDLTRRALDPYSVSTADGKKALYYCYYDKKESRIRQDFNVQRKMGYPRIAVIEKNGELYPIFCMRDEEGVFKWTDALTVAREIQHKPKL